MTDEKDKKDNVVVGPWGDNPVDNNGEWVKEKYDKALDKNNTQLRMQDKLAKIDIITENLMVQLIHTVSENGYNISDEGFILDIGFLSEAIKGILSRQDKIPHIIQGLVDNIMSPEETKNDDGVDLYYSRFDAPLLQDLIDMADDIRNEDDSTEIAFESDLELEDDTNKISDWKPSDEFKVDKSMNEKRNKKLSKKKDDDDDNGNEF
jgi:hypothetical protein|tara:strand:+ start:127 stop:747 length:621 start_codon:yes stop_codon:yes gene_type:complete